MEAAAARPEYAVFQDEWDAQSDARARTPLDAASVEGYCTLGRSVDVTYGPSYRDFGCWFANSGSNAASAYIGTIPIPAWPPIPAPATPTWPRTARSSRARCCGTSGNTRSGSGTSSPSGGKSGSEPLEWVVHMTNTLVLPLHTWATADLDHELANDQPFSPEWLRTETTGRQIGNLPLSLYAVAGSANKVVAGLAGTMSKEQIERLRARVEWGMRHSPRDPAPRPAGQVLDRFRLWRRWRQACNVLGQKSRPGGTPGVVKWLVLSDPAKKAALIVLASWSAEAVDAEFSLRGEVLGFDARGCRLSDAETGAILSPALTGACKRETRPALRR